MSYLVAVSIIWAFSFGLYKAEVANLDPNFVAWARMLFALPLFLPVCRITGIPQRTILRLVLLGAVQYGIMYCLINYSYQFLKGYEVALFTITTPLYITILNDIIARRFQYFYAGIALLAILGCAIIVYSDPASPWINVTQGFLVIQACNFCFAAGQITYRQIRPEFAEYQDREVYVLLFVGAVIVTALATTVSGGWADISKVTLRQFLVLIYLGCIASGLGFYLWNKAAVSVGTASLAAANNLKIPLAVAAAVLVFNEEANIPRLLLGGAIVAIAVGLAEAKHYHERKTAQPESPPNMPTKR